MNPDFLIIPKIVHDHEELQPSDWILYGVVYWYEHMRDGKCIAGNEALARVARVGERSVRGSLDRLERAGFIRRVFRDKKRKDRAQILCLVKYGIQEPAQPSPDQAAMPGMEVATTKPHVETPGEYARRFFSGDQQVLSELSTQLTDAGVPLMAVQREMTKFIGYWTEPTKSGKRVRWELEPTFDVKRRLGTWFRNAAERGARSAPRAGTGVTV